MTADNLIQLIEQIEELKQNKVKAQGSYEYLKKATKTNYGCSTVKQCEAELAKGIERGSKLVKTYRKKKKAFDKQWSRRLQKIRKHGFS